MSTPRALVRVIVQPDMPSALGGRTVPALSPYQVHVWRQRLLLSQRDVQPLLSLLSPDERDRAQRFRFDKDQISFIVCRATLRALLAQYSSRLPADIQFLYSEYGRPALPQSTDAAVVEFNVSHSDEIALLAFARGFRIGIDVEKVRSDFNPFEIAERFFSSAERKALSEVPANEQHEAFF